MSIPRFGMTHPVPVNLLMAAILIGGAVSAITLTREFFPDTTPDSAVVALPYPGASPAEVEEGMARKVEDALADLDEVERLTTTLAEGGGGITVEFRSDIDDLDKAVNEVERAIDTLRDLPDEAEQIDVREFKPQMPTIMITLFGDAEEEALKRAIHHIRDDLNSLPGMGRIVVSGVRDYEIRIDVSPGALLEHRLSLPQVADQIRLWMVDVPGGSVRTGVGDISVRTIGVPEQAQAIRQIVVKASPQGQALRVGDIDSDGDADLVVGDWVADNVLWLENLGAAASWTANTLDPLNFDPRGVAIADLDGDGDLDVVAGCRVSGGEVRLMMNQTLHGAATISTSSMKEPLASMLKCARVSAEAASCRIWMARMLSGGVRMRAVQVGKSIRRRQVRLDCTAKPARPRPENHCAAV